MVTDAPARPARRTPRRPLPGGLLLRGALARRGLSLAVVVAAVLTTAAAALGPTYARAVAESTLRDQLLSAPARQTGVRLAAVYYDTSSPDLQLEAALALPFSAPATLFGHAERIVSLSLPTVARAGAGERVTATVVSRTGACEHLVLVSGRCPAGSDEVVVSDRSRAIPGAGWRLGSTLVLDDGGRARIVGTYRPRDEDDAFWFGDLHFEQGPDSANGVRSDDLFADRSFFTSRSGDLQVREAIDYPLDPDRIRLDDLPLLRQDLRTENAAGGLLPGSATTETGLGDVLDAADRERALADTGTLLVCLQLGLLGLLVLFQIAADLAEARGPDIALAKLRGHRPWQVLGFGLAGPVLLLVVATPVGIAAGIGAAALLGSAALVPGTPVVGTPWSVLAGLVALAGGVAAVALAAARVLTRPVTAQWRRTAGARHASRLSLVVDGAVVVLAAAGLVVLRVVHGGASGSTALLAPGLLVLAVALVGVRLLPVVLRPTLPRTRASSRVGLLLATRQVVRRPAGIRLATLLAVAIGLAAFAVGGQAAASGNREARAAAEIGATRVLRVQAGNGGDPVRAVRSADPDGRWAMAAATWLPDGGDSVLGTVLAVDADRLARVALPARGGLDGAALARAVAARTVAPIAVQGDRLTATITADRLRGTSAPNVQFELLDRLGRSVEASAPVLRPGTADYGADVPCETGCTLLGITWVRPTLAVGDVSGVTVVHRLAQRSGGRTTAVDARLDDVRAWRAAVPVSEARDAVTVGPAGVRDRFSGDSGYGGIASSAQPRVLRAVTAPRGLIAGTDPRHGALEDGLSGSVDFRVSATSAVLPRVLADGVLLDAEQLVNALPGFTSEASWEVWLSSDAPPDAVRRIERAGLPVQSIETAGQRQTLLGRSGPALAFLLLVVSAVVGAVLAAIGTAVAIGASARRRSYELAALRAVGVPRRALLRAALLEQLLLLGTAAALGIPGGFVAGLLALPVIPEFGSPTPVELHYVPGVGAVLLFAVAFGLLVLAAATVAALDLLRRSVPGRLREAEE